MNTDSVHLALLLEQAVQNHPLEPGSVMRIEAVYRRFWWPDLLASPLLWRNRVVSYRYFVDDWEVIINNTA